MEICLPLRLHRFFEVYSSFAAQILLNNLITDMPMIAVASDNVDIEMLRKPKKLILQR